MFQDIQAVDTDVKQKSDAYSSCIGAGLAVDGFIHDTGKGALSKEINFTLVSVLVGVLGLVLVITMVLMSVLPYTAEKKEETRLQQLEVEYEQGLVAYNEYMATKKMYDEILVGTSKSMHANDNLVAFLEEMEQKMPYDVVFEAFSSNDEECTIDMVVQNKEIAAKVIDTFRDFKSVMAVEVTGLTEEEIDYGEDEEAPTHMIEDENGNEVEILEPLVTKISFQIVCHYYPQGYGPDDANAAKN